MKGDSRVCIMAVWMADDLSRVRVHLLLWRWTGAKMLEIVVKEAVAD